MIEGKAAALAALGLMFWGTGVAAAPLTADALRTALAPRLLAQAERDPAAFGKKLASLTTAYGKDGALGPDGIDHMGLVMRAKIRADEVARLMAADLDGDGQATEAERADLVATLSPGRLKRFSAAWDAADADHSGSLTAAEAMAEGAAAAEKAMGPERLAEWKTLMVMDDNGDGRLTGDEATAALALLGPGKAKKSAAACPPGTEPDGPAGSS